MSESAPIEHPSGLTSGDLIEADEPLRLFAAWFEQAARSEPRDPTAMSLATVDADGLPNVRMVLMKGFGEAGFVFYTNVDSQKGHELDREQKAALLFHWKSVNRQVRLRGPVERFRDAPAPDPDRRLGQQTVGTARKPPRVREGDRVLHREIRPGNRPTTAELDWLSPAAASDRVLARAAVPAA
jgi:hypothetical protein